MKIAIAGTGYAGLVSGVCLASIGHQVIGVDIEEYKVMRKNADRLTYTTDYTSAYRDAEVIFIAVGTPEKKDGSVNLNYVYEAAKQIAVSVEKDCIVAVKSTVPVGTNNKIEKILKTNLNNSVSVEVASNPEFLSQGTAIKDTLHASRIVLGVESDYAEKVLRKVYDGFNQPYVITDRKSAEMIKYASNDFLALKISYINEIANLCEILGANIEDVARGMGFDQRIGNKFLMAGIGYGGSCFPKDTKALQWHANCHDYELKTIKAAIEVNENQKTKLIKKARKYYENFHGLTVAVLGLTYKPGTDDLREAPSLQNIPSLLEDGANIKAWDPLGVENYKKIYPTEIAYCGTIEEAISCADVCLIFTEWPQIKEFDVSKFAKLMRKPLVLDGRNCYDLNKLENLGVTYVSIGRRTIVGNKFS
jgi:UDPglucose 6-dehydrogenase